jgi:hypothetical protein
VVPSAIRGAVEGERPQVEAFCAKLVERLGVDRDYASAVAQPLSADVREEIGIMSAIGYIKAFGGINGRGLVVLSDRPVNFHPSNKTSNVVMVDSLDDTVRCIRCSGSCTGWPTTTSTSEATA